MSFIQRVLGASFVLGTGTFGSTGSNQTNLTGNHRMSVKINRAGGPAMSTVSGAIYGMKLDLMNQLSTLGLVATTLRRNSVTFTAGDADNQATVFQGTITNAYPDFNSGDADVPFRVEAHTGLIDAVQPTNPQTFNGAVDVATVLSGLAGIMGVPFENNGVSVILHNAYFYGSPRQQALAAVKAAGICWNGMEDGTLAIWNPGQARGGQIPMISKDTGMVGYPSFTANGIALRTIFNPSIGFGKNVQVQSAVVPAANGKWTVHDLNHDLEANTPHGSWFTDLKAAPVGSGPYAP